MSSNPLLECLPPDHIFCSDRQVWAKCDMIITLGFERITRPHRRIEGKRDYTGVRVSATDLDAIFAGVRSYLPAARIENQGDEQ